MKHSYPPAKTLLTKDCVTFFVFLLAFVPATYSQVGPKTPWIWKKGSKVPFGKGN